MDKITIERETLERAIAEVSYLQSQTRLANEHTQTTLDSLRAALAAQPAEPVEPVAWLRFQEHADRPTTVHLCDSDHPRAFQVYAAQPAPAAVPTGYALVPIEPTEAMVNAYLHANDEYWKRADELPPSLFKWRNGTPQDATAESYRAMIAAAGDKP